MKRAQLPDVSRRRVRQVLQSARGVAGVAARIDRISALFIDSPYVINPLTGSAKTPERFTASLDGFDCVTYIETVLALAVAQSEEEFLARLRTLRYEDGRVRWEHRNHYMTGWIRNNIRAGAIHRVRFPGSTRVKQRVLDVIPGFPPRTERFSCIPKQSIASARADVLRSGDLVFFVSTRRHLDIFHCGILIRRGDRLVLRHAARSKGAVVELDLADFLESNRMAGVIVVRPREVEVRSKAS